MKIFLTATAVIALLAVPAQAGIFDSNTTTINNTATGGAGGAGGKGGNANAHSSSTAYGGNAVAVQGQQQGQKQGQAQGQHQSNKNYNSDVNVNGQGQSQNANNEGNDQSVTFEDRRQAPAFGLGGLASGPCTGVSGGFAVTTPLGGGGVSGAAEDVECTKRETARVLFAIGMRAEARAVAMTFGPLVDARGESVASAERPVAVAIKRDTFVAPVSTSYGPE